MKINLICQYCPPEIGAPQARLSEMAKEWVHAGHSVTYLTGFPNHPTGIIPKEYRGKIFKVESQDGVKIWRHWLYATPNEGFLKKIFAHITFAASIILLSLFRGPKPDVIIVSSPNFFSVISAYIMSRVRRVPYIFEVRDLWPGIFIDLGVLKNKTLIKLLEKIELFLYKKASLVVPVTNRFADNIVNRGISPEKVKVITNGVDLDFYKPGFVDINFRKKIGVPTDAFVVMYLGAHGISHGLSSVLDAAEKLQTQGVHFLFVGEGAEKSKLVSIANTKGLSNITFVQGQPKQQILNFYSAADACLVTLRNVDGLSTFIPSKMFEIMGCGKPIVAALRGEAAEIFERSSAAAIVSPEDSSRLAATVVALKNDTERCKIMGQNGRRFVENNYDRKVLAQNYLKIINDY